jgi:hypothetical protein
MVTQYYATCVAEREPAPDIKIGPRLYAELRRRIHELENRYKRTLLEQRELAALREILKRGCGNGCPR